jgi:hypothetical protein
MGISPSADDLRAMIADPLMADLRILAEKAIRRVALARAYETAQFDSRDEMAEGCVKVLWLLYQQRRKVQV